MKSMVKKMEKNKNLNYFFINFKDLKSFFSLKFDDEKFEKLFLEEYNKNNLNYMRFAMIMGMLFYGIFSFLDITIAGENINFFWLIRFGIIIFAISTVSFSYRIDFFKKHLQKFFAISVFFSGLGTLAMTLKSEPAYADLYYAGVILIIFFGYAATHIRFVYALFSGISILAIYEVITFVIAQDYWMIITHYTFNFIIANVIGILVSVRIEKLARMNFKQKKEIQEMSIRDFLTGLYNRAYLEKKLNEIINLKERNKNLDVCVIFIDLDGFKKINDTFGHDEGDEVLKKVSKMLENEKRKSDFVFRIGGDEFILVIYGDLESSIVFSKRLLEKLKTTDFGFKNNKKIEVGFSAGCVPVDNEMKIPDDILKKADSLMYKAKNSGKGKVEFDFLN